VSPVEPGDRVPDTAHTAPRTRFTKSISYSVWTSRATRGARELYGMYGKQHSFCTLHTYPFHDGDPLGAMKRGVSASVDFYVTGANWNAEPTAEQTRVGRQIVAHAVRNWTRLGLDKIIWRGKYTRDGRNWYAYKPWTYKHWGMAKAPTRWHRNHPHCRFKR